jgi:hypothetical protein
VKPSGGRRDATPSNPIEPGSAPDRAGHSQATRRTPAWDVQQFPQELRAGAPTKQQEDQLEYTRRRRAMATEAKGTVSGGGGKGLMYTGTPKADPNPTGAASGFP